MDHTLVTDTGWVTPPRSTGTPGLRAARASISPITAVPSHRRASSHAGSSTCVTPRGESPRLGSLNRGVEVDYLTRCPGKPW